MSIKSPHILLVAAVAATTILSSATPVSAIPVWLPGKDAGDNIAEQKSPEMIQMEREMRQLRRQQRIQERQARREERRQLRRGE